MTKILKFSESIESCTEIFQIFGLQLFTVRANAESGSDCRSKLSKKHKASLTFILFLIVLKFCAIAYGMNLELQNQQNKNVATAFMIHFVSYVGMNLSVVAAVINSYSKRNHLREIFNDIEKITKIIVIDLNLNFSFDKFSKNFKLTLLKLISLFACASLLVLGFNFYHNKSNDFLWAVLAVFLQFFLVINYLYLIFFILLVRESLMVMKNTLEKLKKSHELAKLTFEIINSRKDARKKASEMFDTIFKMKKVYSILSEIVELVNYYFGAPIMMQFVNLIISSLSASYKVKK